MTTRAQRLAVARWQRRMAPALKKRAAAQEARAKAQAFDRLNASADEFLRAMKTVAKASRAPLWKRDQWEREVQQVMTLSGYAAKADAIDAITRDIWEYAAR